jgi:MoaA/NifB/PqqE/SkfB family radical SAM enzyme
MKKIIQNHLEETLHHLYINPLEKCNLRCAICYTRKTSPILSKAEILRFINKYNKSYPLKTITFCGGEVFTLPYFPSLINTLTDQGFFIQVITNGTIDRLDKITNPNSVNLIVSIDGLKDYHDANRGPGNFDKSMEFITKALSLGFHAEIFTIVTRQNYQTLDEFESFLFQFLGKKIAVTYHPRKPPTYLNHHPVSNTFGKVEGFDFLTDSEMIHLLQNRNTFPPKNLGCYQIALSSNGSVYGCCEGITPIGTIDDGIETLIKRLKKIVTVPLKESCNRNCLGCSYPDFVCGMKEYL